MIVRRASEIIRGAVTLSQIQNTDALSWRDKIDMLNQSYVRLYDDLNNNGDLYYSKEIIFDKVQHRDGDYEFDLPKDFWKLLIIGYRSAMGGIVPIERAPNTTQYFSGYRIVNNKLVFSNYFLPGALVVRYLPQPQTITFPRQGYKLPGRAIMAAYDSTERVIVLGNADRITVFNESSGETLNKSVEGRYVLAVSAGVIYIVKETGIYCFDFELNEVSSLDGIFDLYAHAIGWERGIIVSGSGEFFRYVSGEQLEPSADYWNYMDGVIKRTSENDLFTFTYQDNEGVKDLTELFEGADSYVISDPFIYVNRNGLVKVYENFEGADYAPAIVGHGSRKGLVLAAEANNETGYGVIFNDHYSGLLMSGFASDTVMNYPQNIFFDWLIADLAVKFRIALDIPTGELLALRDDYHDTLMRGISRDAYQNARINNCYARAYI
jgi:hypothetical protein